MFKGYWDMGARIQGNGYAMKANGNESHYFCAAKLFTKRKIRIQMCHNVNNYVKHLNIFNQI